MKNNIITRLQNISIKNKLFFIVGVMLFLIALELITLYSMVYILSATRAYVGGEGFWSKAEKDATIYLIQYANTHDEKDYQKYLSFISVVLGDKQARIALMQPHPNYNMAYQGFLQGRNVPADIPGLINLFIWFQHTNYLKKAGYYWFDADTNYIPKLIAMATKLHQSIINGTFTPTEHEQFIKNIYNLNAQLTVLADNFSYALGEASRWAERVVLRTVVSIAITVELSGLLLTVLVTFNIRKGIDEIMRVAKKVMHLDFSSRATRFSNDEIGQLATTFNQMIDDLEINIAERERAQKNVIKLSRLTGMAEVATNVLHNVGNTLNSINTSVTFLQEKNKNSKMAHIIELNNLLNEHRNNLADFLSHDKKGQQVLPFISLLSHEWKIENDLLKEELNSLTKFISHVKNIIMLQQSLSRTTGITEEISINDFIEEAIIINKLSYERAAIKILREYSHLKPIVTDKDKLLQILVNIIKNALDALVEQKVEYPSLIIRSKEKDSAHVMVQFIDNGIGILQENITKIFSHGFSTKKDGHGFGLHTSALFANELGGTLFAESQGIGYGATFTLILPYQR